MNEEKMAEYLKKKFTIDSLRAGTLDYKEKHKDKKITRVEMDWVFQTALIALDIVQEDVLDVMKKELDEGSEKENTGRHINPEEFNHDVKFSNQQLIIMIALVVGQMKRVGLNPAQFVPNYDDKLALKEYQKYFSTDKNPEETMIDLHYSNLLAKMYNMLMNEE